jgi:hypothetical protein
MYLTGRSATADPPTASADIEMKCTSGPEAQVCLVVFRTQTHTMRYDKAIG